MSKILKAQDLIEKFLDQAVEAMDKIKRQGDGNWLIFHTRIDSKSLSCSVDDAKRVSHIEADDNWQSKDKIISEFVKQLRALGYVIAKNEHVLCVAIHV